MGVGMARRISFGSLVDPEQVHGRVLGGSLEEIDSEGAGAGGLLGALEIV
jgi:hypothetical protein